MLLKPFWAPPAYLFGPVWAVLYILITISFGRVLTLALSKKIKWVVAVPFILNLVFNLAYTPIMFGLRNLTLASIDIVLVLGTLIWAMVAIWKHAKWIAYIQIPYLVWVTFATVLQFSILFLNL